MSGRPDLKVRRSEVLLGVAERIQGRRGWEPASRQELIRAGLLGSGILLVLGIDPGRWLCPGQSHSML